MEVAKSDPGKSPGASPVNVSDDVIEHIETVGVISRAHPQVEEEHLHTDVEAVDEFDYKVNPRQNISKLVAVQTKQACIAEVSSVVTYQVNFSRLQLALSEL